MQKQQGDVIFKTVQVLPKGAKKLKGAVFAEGEGHHLHRAADAANVALYEIDGIKYAKVKARTTVEHVTPSGLKGERNPITLEPGVYQFGQVVEYDYLAEMNRTVVD